MRTLVVYYSRTGHTRQIAKEIAERCGADLEEISELHPRQGAWGAMLSAVQVLFGARPAIKPTGTNPDNYDMVVLGTPVWIQRPAPAVSSYLQQYGAQCKQVAFFCTEGGRGERQAFEAMHRLCHKEPKARWAVTEKQLPEPLHAANLVRFTDAVMGPQSQPNQRM